jgi:hypothetical protein
MVFADGCWFTLAKISHISELHVGSPRMGKQSIEEMGEELNVLLE